LTAQIPPTLGWVDSFAGTNANVTALPYHVSTDFWVNLQYWRDLEFWNKSVDRSAQVDGAYDYTGIWFPKLGLTFDAKTGKANISPSRYAVQSITDTRFQLAGVSRTQSQFANLIEADQPWHATYLTRGTYDDGWLEPGKAATIRLFPADGQRGPRVRYLNLQLWAPENVDSRPFEVRSNLRDYRGVASVSNTSFVNALPVCVPANGYADVRIDAQGASAIPGDVSTLDGSLQGRLGSVFLADASVSDDLGGACRPAKGT
jgi:hypothetical protein